jgi:hypothetical protein
MNRIQDWKNFDYTNKTWADSWPGSLTIFAYYS